MKPETRQRWAVGIGLLACLLAFCAVCIAIARGASLSFSSPDESFGFSKAGVALLFASVGVGSLWIVAFLTSITAVIFKKKKVGPRDLEFTFGIGVGWITFLIALSTII